MSRRYEDPSNYTLELMTYRWYIPENSFVTQYEYKTLKTHVCTEDELGFGRDRSVSRFYDYKDTAVQDVRRMIGNWNCIDEDQKYALQGYYSSSQATNLLLRLTKCQNPTEEGAPQICEDLDPTNDLRKFWIATLTNERLFDVALPENKQTLEQAGIVWHAISIETPIE